MIEVILPNCCPNSWTSIVNPVSEARMAAKSTAVDCRLSASAVAGGGPPSSPSRTAPRPPDDPRRRPRAINSQCRSSCRNTPQASRTSSSDLPETSCHSAECRVITQPAWSMSQEQEPGSWQSQTMRARGDLPAQSILQRAHVQPAIDTSRGQRLDPVDVIPYAS